MTDSVGSRSDSSGHWLCSRTGRIRMDDENQRKKAFEEVQQACNLVNCHHVQFEKLDFGETTILETFYNADVAVVDLSIQLQQSALFYHLGVRESFGMKENILLYNDQESDLTLMPKRSRSNFTFVPYKTWNVALVSKQTQQLLGWVVLMIQVQNQVLKYHCPPN